MHLDFSSQNDQEGVLSLSIEEKDYQENVAQSLKEYQKSMRFPGFRKGKTPLGLVKKQIGTDLKKEEVNKLIQGQISEYYRENRKDIIFMPLMDDIDPDWQNDEDFKFTFRVAKRPQFDIDVKALSSVESRVLKLSNKELEKEIENLRKQYGDVEQQEEVIEHDELVTVFRAVELNEDGAELENGFTKIVRLEGTQLTDGLKKLLLGRKKEEEFDINLKEALTEKELKQIFEVDKQVLKDLNDQFRITIQGSILLKEAELNEEFFQKVFNSDAIKDEEGFRERISQNLKDFFDSKDSRKLQTDVKEFLLSKTEVVLPEEFLKLWYARNAKVGEDENLDEKIEEFVQTTKWDLILEKMAEDYELTVADEEIKNSIRSYVIQQYAYQMSNLDRDQIEGMVENLYGQEYFRLELRQNLLEDKVVKELKNKGTFAQTELSKAKFEEFAKENEL